MNHQELQDQIHLAASREGMTMWKNNVGVAWQGEMVSANGAKVTLKSGKRLTLVRAIILINPRMERHGLCVGSSDLVGIVPVDGLGVFGGIEVKTEHDTLKPDQRGFMQRVNNRGGRIIVARCPSDVKRLRNDF
jgi:hypothetical protein